MLVHRGLKCVQFGSLQLRMQVKKSDINDQNVYFDRGLKLLSDLIRRTDHYEPYVLSDRDLVTMFLDVFRCFLTAFRNILKELGVTFEVEEKQSAAV